SRRTGDIITRFQDAGVVKNILTNTALTLLIDLSMVVIVGLVLVNQSSSLFAITLIMAALSGILIFLFRAPYRRLNRKSMEQNARLNSQVIESLNNVETVKTNGSEERTMENIEAEYIKALRIDFKGGVLNNIQTSLSSEISSVGNLALLIYGGYLAIDGSITLGTLIAFISLTGYFIDPISRLVSLQLSIQEADISLKRLSEILDVEEENESQTGKDELNEPVQDLEIDDVSFRYGTRPPVLNNVSIHIGPGEKVAIVGRSGCGKTTLSKLVLKFYEPTSGVIRINGRDISEMDSFSLRRHIGCVPQNVQTFSGSIRENLVMGLFVSKQELDRACDIAGCTEFIRRLPAGYDTFLDETGGGLSGGEKQRLILARAILRDPDLLILDEATSNMDFITEKTTFDLVFKKLKDKPMLIIAHRLSTIRHCDRIYVMDSGRVVESGTHDELLELKGPYYRLWSGQIGDAIEEEVPSESRMAEHKTITQQGDITYD
ncbi:MAG: peptidase domain-containing ABC transporter, partial [Candidatus Methanomethylophilaceae archaeon]|nr:peptidase domain-containing ABC transporter [Candidatus Methanomethylophilaceae archaeon]